jgi:hypothetical protein
MTTVFIGGSRSITGIAPLIQPRLDAIVERDHAVVIGDATGADTVVQQYLAAHGYHNVTVFYSGRRWRANIGSWPTRVIPTTAPPGTAAFHTAKDVAMAETATCGLMLWDMRSGGTFANIVTLLRAEKPLLLYLSPENTALTLRTLDDLTPILARCPESLRTQLQRRGKLVA